MAIDKEIYNKGIKGLLSYWEIESLPKDYEFLKGMFKEATDIKEGKKKNFTTFHAYEPTQPKKMNTLQEELRMMQVISRATYGMNTFRGNAPGTVTSVHRTWLGKLIYYLNPKKLWNMWKLKCDLKKLWREDSKKRREACKQLKDLDKEMRKNLRYNTDTGGWKPIASC